MGKAKRICNLFSESNAYIPRTYRKEAQKCYCESTECRGYIGASKSSTIDLDGSRITPKQRIKIAEIDQKLKAAKDEFEDIAVSLSLIMNIRPCKPTCNELKKH